MSSKRSIFAILLLAVLSVGFLLWPTVWADGNHDGGSNSDTKNVQVVWSVQGCQMNLDPANVVDLGTASNGETLTSQPFPLTIDSNCPYVVKISLDKFEGPASDQTLLSRYQFETSSVNNPDITNLQPTFTTFSSVGDVKSVCASKDGAAAPFTNHECDVRFQVDTNMLPAGDYTAYHTVTLSTP